MATSSQPFAAGAANGNDSQRHSSSRLEDQPPATAAAAAALYVTNHDRQQSKTGQEFLNKHHRLSSAGAAASLKYASPQDLPSYPSSGLKNTDSAAGAAASLGWANQKPFEHWKPDKSASAAAAATMAKDYKMAPSWQPEASSSGVKAALMAHRDNGKVGIWQPEASSPWGNSAAAQAFKKFGAGTLSPQLDYGFTARGRQGSLIAANGAMAKGRKRAESTPIIIPKPETYPDERNATSNALRAATSAHNRGERSPEGGSSPYTNMSREMYTFRPPVTPEVEEKNRRDSLHASAVAMAQGMYKRQQKQFDATMNMESQRGAATAHGRTASMSSASTEIEPMRFNNLQEAAHKLAQERLAKLHDEHAKNREYRDYYGNTKQPSKLSIRARNRRRASSDGKLYEDREQSDKIRAQMSIFSNNVQQVDAKKQRQDREALLAAAQRNVTQKLQGMDKKVFAETGKVAPSLLSEWEVKAHAAAQTNSNTRMENYGKVNIGGGKFVDQAAIDLVAQRNVQPVLDEINQKAEAERERQAAVKADQATEARKAAEKKQREKETKEINKKLKQQDKEEEKMRKADEKAAKKEEDRLAKERRKSTKSEPVIVIATGGDPEPKGESPVATTAVSAPKAAAEHGETIAARREVQTAPTPITTSTDGPASMRENGETSNGDEVASPSPTTSPGSGGSGNMKNWLKSKFSKRGSKISKTSPNAEDGPTGEKGFIGGTALTGATAHENTSAGSLGADSSMRKVALAGKGKELHQDERIGRPARRASDTSLVSSMGKKTSGEDEEFQEARDNFDEVLAPPQPQFPVEKAHSPARDSKFKEEI